MDTPHSPNLLVVCGATASGKTALAVALARELGGEIISADSRQVYRGLDIGSGKDLHEYAAGGNAIPYHLIDIADPADVYTLFHFQRDFYRVFCEVAARGHLPVLCGGTGLYIEAVLRGYDIPEVPEDREVRAQLLRQDKHALEQMLAKLDREIFARTDRSSKKRIVRAVEVARCRRNSLPKSGAAAPAPPLPALRPLILCTRWDRQELRSRIDCRLNERLSNGMIDEVRSLRANGLSDERLCMLGMEYKFITRYLRGEVDCAAMTEQLRHSIHQLAKRQDSYFRGMERRGSATCWIDDARLDDARAIIRSTGLPAPDSAPQ